MHDRYAFSCRDHNPRYGDVRDLDNFDYKSPTRIVFGKDEIESLPELLREAQAKRVLLVYGRKAVKDLGIHKRVQEIASTMDIELYEEAGVRPNPELESVKSGRRKVLEHGIDFILAAGGGSVMDCAKAIAFSAFKKEEGIWDVFLKKHPVNRALPLGVIVTMAATGSETNGNTVISNDARNDKRSIKNDNLIPAFAIIDPSYTVGLSKKKTVAGSIDIMTHIFEQYFSPTKRTLTSDYMSLGILKSVVENTQKILQGKDSYDARANLSWASTLALNWILQQGKEGDWASHNLSYPPTSKYRLTHGYALAVIHPAWMKMALAENPSVMRPKLQKIGSELFADGHPDQVIRSLKNLYATWGAPTSFREMGIEIGEREAMEYAKKATFHGSLGSVVKITAPLAKRLYLTC